MQARQVWRYRSLAALAAAAAALWGASARAYSYESPVGSGCHEALTLAALRNVRDGLGTPPIEPSPNERALIADLPFRLEPDAMDLAGAALMIGVRDPDLKGLSGLDLHDLATIHGHPSGQREHCLRRPEQDEPQGSQAALADCRAYIRESVVHALAWGLDRKGLPDPSRRTVVDVHLDVLGPVKVELPIFYVYLGQALHALQDSYTHTFRTQDGRRVKSVLNWVEFANEALEEQRDGPAHMLALDRCDDATELQVRNRGMAAKASTQLIWASLDPELSVEQRTAAVDLILDEHLSFEPGCAHSTRWCDAPEQIYRDRLGCNASGVGPLPVALLGVALLARRRRPRPLLAATAVCAMLAVAPASAAPLPEAAGELERTCHPGRQISCACPRGELGVQRCNAQGSGYVECRCELSESSLASAMAPVQGAFNPLEELRPPFGIYSMLAVSSDRAAMALALAGRYRLDDSWRVGAGVEWNPWWSLETRRFKPGTLNVYGSVIRRVPISDSVAIRSSLHLGVSMLLFDLYGARSSSMGPYAAFTVLGLEVKAGRRWLLIIDPFEMAMPVPHLTGAPIAYRQYRITFGFQYGG